MLGTKSSKFKLVMNILDANSSRGWSDRNMETEKKKDRLGLFEKQWLWLQMRLRQRKRRLSVISQFKGRAWIWTVPSDANWFLHSPLTCVPGLICKEQHTFAWAQFVHFAGKQVSLISVSWGVVIVPHTSPQSHCLGYNINFLEMKQEEHGQAINLLKNFCQGSWARWG